MMTLECEVRVDGRGRKGREVGIPRVYKTR